MNILRISLALIISFIALGGIVNADFDQATYKQGDSISFEAVGNEEFMFVWFGTSQLQFNFNCNNGTSTEGFVQLINAQGIFDCSFANYSEDGIGGSEFPAFLGGGSNGGLIDFDDLPLGEYFWVEPDGLNDCDTGDPDNDTFDTCVAKGDIFASGSFTIISPDNLSSVIVGAIQSDMLASAVLLFSENISLVLIFLASFLTLSLLVALARRFFGENMR